MSSAATFFASKNAENRWRNHMRYNYTSKKQITPCVFRVPDYLRDTKPEAYVPQIVGLGPYHHFRPDLQLMATKKRAAVKAYLDEIQKDFNHLLNLVDQSLVDDPRAATPSTFEVMIRSCYDRYIDLGEKTLAWILIVDGTFLLHFVSTYLDLNEQQKGEHKIYPDADKLVPDVFMLENQIPIALLLKIRLFFQLSIHVDKDYELLSKFHLFCTENSPLELTSDALDLEAAYDKNNHLLNFMYQMIMKNDKGKGHFQSQGGGKNGDGEPEGNQGDERGWIQRLKAVTRVPIKKLKIIAREATKYGRAILGQAIEEFTSALNTATNAGLKVPGNVQKISQILQNLENTFQLSQNKQVIPGDKIEIPSATRLFAILNVKFNPLPSGFGIGNIDLQIVDGKRYEFYLPVIYLRANSEVIVKNLVAYEATISKQNQGSTRLRDFVDLMCGLIQTEEDVKLLEKAGIMIIEQGLPREEIVTICNGITKSDEMPDEKSKVHSTVKTANNHFNNATIVKLCRWLVKRVANFWKFIKQFFPLLVLIFLAFQSACEIYDCKRRPDKVTAMQSHLGNYWELDPQAKIMLPRKMLGYQSI